MNEIEPAIVRVLVEKNTGTNTRTDAEIVHEHEMISDLVENTDGTETSTATESEMEHEHRRRLVIDLEPEIVSDFVQTVDRMKKTSTATKNNVKLALRSSLKIENETD
jgi:hypothetical protein